MSDKVPTSRFKQYLTRQRNRAIIVYENKKERRKLQKCSDQSPESSGTLEQPLQVGILQSYMRESSSLLTLLYAILTEKVPFLYTFN